jgi:hypothetical protein
MGSMTARFSVASPPSERELAHGRSGRVDAALVSSGRGRPRARCALIGAIAMFAFVVVATPAAADPLVAAAGDVACDPLNSKFNAGQGQDDTCMQKAVADRIAASNVNAVLPLGDVQYYCGSLSAFKNSYDLSWGQFKPITYPVVGNHEYLTEGGSSAATGCDLANSGAAGYFNYFGTSYAAANLGPTPLPADQPAKGYYSYDIGDWHLIALNSSCTGAGGCGATSPQGKWLRADLAANAVTQCTLAYWHIPLFSSGGRASSAYKTFWDALYAADADVVLNGHDHDYERFAAQDPAGALDSAHGIRAWVVGTGGANHTSFTSTAPNSQVRNDRTHGFLKLTLHPQSYDWEFVPAAGGTFTDGGTGDCHNAPPDTAAPSTPQNLTAQNITATSDPVREARVDLTWSASTDNVGVTAYRIFRDGDVVGIASTTSFSDTSVAAGTTYSYTTRAYDRAGNESASSNAASSANVTLNPVADASVQDSNPSTNYGPATTLKVDGATPVARSYLLFDVRGLAAPATRATLRLFANTAQSTGYDVLGVADTSWTERGITWANAPALDATGIGASGPAAAGVWTSVDVTNLVRANGLLSLALRTTNSTALSLASREASANQPALVVTP